jgi:hypothetical protein
MSIQTPKFESKPDAIQTSIDFEAAEKLLQERNEAAKLYSVVDPKTIYKDTDGEWRFIKDNKSVSEWDAEYKDMSSTNDNSDMYNRGK